MRAATRPVASISGRQQNTSGSGYARAADRRDLLVYATNEAMSTDKGSTIVIALLQRLRDHRIIVPAPASIERIGLAGRARRGGSPLKP